MTETAMATSDDEPLFPATDTYLFVGGPKHGQECEVPADERVFKLFAPPAGPQPVAGFTIPSLSGGLEVNTYVRQELGFEDQRTGEQFVRAVFVHDSVPNPQIGQQLLITALFANFVRGGRKVIEHHGVSD